MNTAPSPPEPSAGALENAFRRERNRRKKAERLLEDRARELYQSNCQLQEAIENLERNQEQLVQQEKMASLGVMSAGVAHEINNPIGFVQSNLNTLAEYLPTLIRAVELADGAQSSELAEFRDHCREEELDYVATDALELIDETRTGLERIKTIVDSLKTFAHTGDEHHTPINLNDCARSALTLARNQLKYRCEVIESYDCQAMSMGDSGRLVQVLLNLIVNAGQAIEEGGKIAVRSFDGDKECVIEVEDNGVGIEPEHMNKLFEPFFTTKPVGEGTGLGLSISFGIIQEMGGRLEVDSEPGSGSTFRVCLPIAQTRTD
ncbi:MAG: ATP-binding protein [Pseudomonadota bacterium]